MKLNLVMFPKKAGNWSQCLKFCKLSPSWSRKTKIILYLSGQRIGTSCHSCRICLWFTIITNLNTLEDYSHTNSMKNFLRRPNKSLWRQRNKPWILLWEFSGWKLTKKSGKKATLEIKSPTSRQTCFKELGVSVKKLTIKIRNGHQSPNLMPF